MARGASHSRKTPQETPLRVPKHGRGKLRVGNPGNHGGGRKPELFYERAKQLCDDPTVWDVQVARARSGDINPLKLAAEYTYEKPTERKELTGEVQIRVVFDE